MAENGRHNGKKRRNLNGQRAKTGAGSPTKWSEAMGQKIVDIIADGHTYTVAAKVCGLHLDTLRKWKKAGREALEQGMDTTPLAEFVAKLTRAEAEAEIKLVALVNEAAAGLEETRVKKKTRPVIVNGAPVIAEDGSGNPILDVDGRVQYVNIEETEVEQSASKDWRAAAFLLAIRYPEKYANRLNVRGKVNHEHSVMSDEDQAIAARIAQSRFPATTAN